MQKLRRWLGLLSLMPATAMVYVDQSILPVALPTIQRHLDATTTQMWWCVNAYILVSAVLLLAGGKLGDRIGHKQTFMWGMALFALSSALCGLSTDAGFLIAARALQGVGAALQLPTAAPIIMTLFPAGKRGRAIGTNASISSLFLVCAPLIGGYFTQALSWRWIFWINLPIALLGILLTALFIPPSHKERHPFEPRGFLLFLLFATSLVFWIMQGGDLGWTSPISYTAFAVAALSGLLFFKWEKKSDRPYIEFSFFRHPIFRAVNIGVFATQFVLMITVYRAVFFQDALGWSPMQSGAVSFITALPLLFISLVGGWLADKCGPKTPITLGFALLIFSFIWVPLSLSSSLALLLLGLFAFSLGIPLVVTPSYSSAMSSIPPSKSGTAFGVLTTTRAFSASLGIAVISSLTGYIQNAVFSRLTLANPLTHKFTPSFLEKAARGIGTARKYLTSDQFAATAAYFKEAAIHSFFAIHLIIAAALLVAFGFVFTLYHRYRSDVKAETPAEGWD